MNNVPPKDPALPGVTVDNDIDLLDLLQALAARLRLLLLAPIVVAMLAFCIALFITPTFTATAKFLPPQQQQSAAASMLQSLGALGGVAGAAAGLKNPGEQFVSLLQSRVVADALVDKLQLMERYEKTLREDARAKLKKNSVITIGKDNIIVVNASDPDPVFAARIANEYIEELGALLSRLAITEAQQRRVFFEKQLAGAKDSLVRAEQSLASSGVDTSALNATPASALEGPARLRAQVTAQEIRLAGMRSYLTESAPEYRIAQIELKALREQLAKAAAGQTRSGDMSEDYISKFREFKYQEALFEMFARQYEIARVDESKEGSVVQVVDAAVPPERKSSPAKVLIALGAAAATLILLVLWILLRSVLSTADPHKRAKAFRLRETVRRGIFGER